MTKEEALKILRKDLLSNLVDYYSSEELQDAIDTIVSQPSLPSDLDEAAKQAVGSIYDTPLGKKQLGLFKAGVKFQAEQGYNREAEVKEDAGGYPYIDEIELYDYDNDKPLAKKGDKVRIQITKVE